MGSGGLLLSNYQEELLEYFEPDVDFLLYANYEDAVEKASFYIKNEKEREKIIQHSMAKLRAEHTYLQRVKVMCSYVEDYWM